MSGKRARRPEHLRFVVVNVPPGFTRAPILHNAAVSWAEGAVGTVVRDGTLNVTASSKRGDGWAPTLDDVQGPSHANT
ncbi:MAG: hypothetical protein M3313_10260 [Actinomycetota bacterium]|nr:hypothetical protein [Actinomycetota bacterium]